MSITAQQSPKVAAYILAGPQAIGKTRYADELARLLNATGIIDGWDGVTELPAGALAITNIEISEAPAGSTVFQVESEADIKALLKSLEPSAC